MSHSVGKAATRVVPSRATRVFVSNIVKSQQITEEYLDWTSTIVAFQRNQNVMTQKRDLAKEKSKWPNPRGVVLFIRFESSDQGGRWWC